MKANTEAPVVLGKFSGVHGVRGVLKVHSWTEPRENILEYPDWQLQDSNGQWQPIRLIHGTRQGPHVLAQIEGVEDRDQALALLDRSIGIARDELPPPSEGEYYWCDLIGLKVINTDAVEFGEVTEMMSTAANDVLVVSGGEGGERERLIPFIQPNIVQAIDLEAGLMTVVWDAEF